MLTTTLSPVRRRVRLGIAGLTVAVLAAGAPGPTTDAASPLECPGPTITATVEATGFVNPTTGDAFGTSGATPNTYGAQFTWDVIWDGQSADIGVTVPDGGDWHLIATRLWYINSGGGGLPILFTYPATYGKSHVFDFGPYNVQGLYALTATIEQCVTDGTVPTIPTQTDPAPTDPAVTTPPSSGGAGSGGALPETGSSSVPTAVLALLAVAGGVATVGVARRRQRSA